MTNVNKKPTTNTAHKWRPKNVTNKWKTSYSQPTLPVSHNQFVSYATPKSTSINNNELIKTNNESIKTNNDLSERNYSGSTLNKSRYILSDYESDTSSSESQGVNASMSVYRHVDVSEEIKNLNSASGSTKTLNLKIHVKNEYSNSTLDLRKFSDEVKIFEFFKRR